MLTEADYADFYEHAPDIYYSVDMATGHLVLCNQTAVEITGYSTDELIGRPVWELYENECHPQVHAALREVQQSGHVRDVELRLRCKSGRVLDVSLNASAIRDHEGRTVATRSLVRDISRLKSAERELADTNERMEQLCNKRTRELRRTTGDLRAAQQHAERANRAKSQFLANVSHELRTPMTSILGYAELLKENLHDPDDALAVDTILRNGQYLLALLNDILDLTKIESGQYTTHWRQCVIADLLGDLDQLLRIRADAKGLTLEFHTESGVPDEIETDPIRLRQILINLIGNAIKFTEIGSIRVVARFLSPERRIQFDVIDGGIGLSRDELGRLFRPFSQLDGSMTRKHGGTGLGLAISKKLAEMLGGTITVESCPGEGSRFRLELPVGSRSRQARLDPGSADPFDRHSQPGDVSHRQPLAGVRVLLAEDGDDNRALFTHFLHKAGAHVTAVGNGLDAVNLLLRPEGDTLDEGILATAASFDVVLMDLQMPVMDGYEATRRIRNAGLTMPIVALTAHTMDGDRDNSLAAGCTAFTAKPIACAELIQTVQKFVEDATNCRQPALTPME